MDVQAGDAVGGVAAQARSRAGSIVVRKDGRRHDRNAAIDASGALSTIETDVFSRTRASRGRLLDGSLLHGPLRTTRRASLALGSRTTQPRRDFEQSRFAVLLEHVSVGAFGDRPRA